MSDYIINEDILLYWLDRVPEHTLEQVRESKDLATLAVIATYGKDLPQGRQRGSVNERKTWRESERAKRIRQDAADIVVKACNSAEDLEKFYRLYRRRASHGSLVRWIIREVREKIDDKVTAPGL